MAHNGLEAERGRIGGHVTAARHGLAERGLVGHHVAERRLLALLTAEVDPDGSLPVDERERRIAQARKAHFARLALASAKARRQRTSIAAQVEADKELVALRRALVAEP